MAWDTGTITSATPHTALSTKIKNLCTGAWSFVENIPAGTGAGQSGSAAYSVDVFKSDGASNSPGIDWYFGLAIPVSDGSVSSTFIAFEGYDAVNKEHKRQCAVGSGTAPVTAPTGAGYWFNDTYADYNGLTYARFNTPTLNTTGFTYYIKMTNDLLWIATKVGTVEASYAVMTLDSITGVSDPMPLYAYSTQAGMGGFSRLPGVSVNSVSYMWQTALYSWNGAVQSAVTTNATNMGDIWQSQGLYVGRVRVQNRAVSAYQIGGVRGLMPSDMLAFSVGGTVGLGDTMTIGANADWTVVGTSITVGSGTQLHYVTRAV